MTGVLTDTEPGIGLCVFFYIFEFLKADLTVIRKWIAPSLYTGVKVGRKRQVSSARKLCLFF
jgi:hypothetical protein